LIIKTAQALLLSAGRRPCGGELLLTAYMWWTTSPCTCLLLAQRSPKPLKAECSPSGRLTVTLDTGTSGVEANVVGDAVLHLSVSDEDHPHAVGFEHHLDCYAPLPPRHSQPISTRAIRSKRVLEHRRVNDAQPMYEPSPQLAGLPHRSCSGSA
jgi:hypothetical protein